MVGLTKKQEPPHASAAAAAGPGERKRVSYAPAHRGRSLRKPHGRQQLHDLLSEVQELGLKGIGPSCVAEAASYMAQ